jgi:hypothetical protein
MKITLLFILLSFSVGVVVLISSSLYSSYYSSNIVVASDVNINIIQTNQSNNTSNQNINQTIKIMNNHTISNASQPGLGIDSSTGTLYAAYFKGELDKANVYLVSSNDSGKTFSENPVKVNDIEGDAYISDYAIPVKVDPYNKGVYVLWQNVKNNESGINFYESDFGVGDLKLGISKDGGKTFLPSINPSINEKPTEKWYADMAVYNDGKNILIPYIDNNLVTVNNVTSYATDKIDYLTQVNILRSDDSGKTFNKITIDKSACQCCDIDTAFGPDNEVYFTWRDSDREIITPTNPENKYNYNYTDESYDQNALDAGVVDEITYSTARDVVVAHTNDNGSGLIYSEPAYVQKQKWLLNACPVIGPSIEFDSSGRMHVFYFTGNGTEGTGYYYVTSDDLGETFSSPKSILTSEFIPASAIQTDLSIDEKGNVWLTFGTVPDVIGPDENPTRTINVIVMDNQGNIIGKKSFESRQSISSTPSLVSHESNTWLAYPDGENVRILSLSL